MGIINCHPGHIATFHRSAHVRKQSLPVWPPTLNTIPSTFYLSFFNFFILTLRTLHKEKDVERRMSSYCNFTNVRCCFIIGIFGGQ